jgi:hypothetical protein
MLSHQSKIPISKQKYYGTFYSITKKFKIDIIEYQYYHDFNLQTSVLSEKITYTYITILQLNSKNRKASEKKFPQRIAVNYHSIMTVAKILPI